ncbi:MULTISPECIES: amino acid permease [unclassified Haloferax]|uniref:amino acid permease n=1 Tax=unclassified Haloferax TaxID=2625095 RepID=UPI002877192C|nr:MULTISPECIES: amino acid permease [unclassified Haloferax]MDS0242284.1 amino acid permease [Haloferax sp. S2CR25]MDS0445405.1 amino acid permease [Haloferax sp. S2CR25-2]
MADTQSTAGGGDAPGEESVETELSRDMSLADITFIGVGAMIGAGVFALTGFAAGLAGPALTVAFILNGLVAMFTAVSYAELGAAFPEAGGGYLWVKEALADPNGFYAGWMSWFAHAVACALYAVTFGVFLTEFFVVFAGLPDGFVLFGLLDRLLVEKLLAVVMVLAFAYINYRGAEETGKAGVVVTTIKILILGVFVAFGILATVREPNWTATFLDSPSFAPNGLVGVIGAMGFTYIAFEGYEIIVQSGEEVVDPGTNVPKAVFYSMAIVVPIYVLVAFAAIGGIDVTAELASRAGLTTAAPTWQVLGNLGELGIIEAAGQFVPYGVPLLLFAGLAATMSALNATIYSSSRVSFAMGRDRVLPGFFGRIHGDKRTPHWAIGLSAVLIGLMAVLLPIESVAAAADIMFIFLFIQVNWTVVKMRATHPDLPRTYEIPYMPWPPLIGIVLQFILTPFLLLELGLTPGLGAGSEGFVALVTTAVWMALGLVVYYGYSEGKEAEKLEEETPTVVTERAPERRESQVLVPIANPDNAAQLMRTAIDVARDRDAEILVMSAVEVPSQTPISEGRRFVDEKRETISSVMELATDADVPVSGTVRLGHDAGTAILNTIEEHDSDVVLMGWRGRGRRRDYILGSNVDEVVTKAPCDVLVERIGPTDGEVDSILLPTAGGPHAELAAEVCRAIARTNDAEIHVMNVVAPGADESDREDAQRRVDSTAAAVGDDEVRVTTSVREGEDVSTAIVAATEEFDLTVIGATREGLLQQLVFGAIPETVGRDAASTVIMAKRDLGVISWMTRWFKRRRDDYHVRNGDE